jgi:signal transduction histidine kinase
LVDRDLEVAGAWASHFLLIFRGVRQYLTHILIACIMLPLQLLAQDPYYRVIDASDGLPNNEVYGIFQDSKGFIWITTDDGLCRFDGHQFKSFTSTTQSAKAGSNIHEDKLGRIWYENFDGRLYHVSGDTLIALAQGDVNGFTRGIALGDRLYYPMARQLDIYDIASLQKIASFAIDSGEFTGVNNMGAGRYWMQGTEWVLGVDAGGHPQRIALPYNRQHAWRGVTLDYAGEVYFLDYYDPSKRILKLKDGVFQDFANLKEPSSLQHHAVFEGKLWCCHTRGLEVVDLKTGQMINSRVYFPDKSITAVMVDREGNHWFGTHNQGLLFVPDFSSQSIPSPSGGLSRIVNTPTGLLAGSQDGAFLRYDTASGQLKVVGRIENRHAVDFLAVVKDQIVESSPAASFRRIGDLQFEYASRVAIKDADLVSQRYLALVTSGSAGLLELPTADTLSVDPWDSIAASHRNPLNAEFYDPLLGRGRAVAHRLGEDAVYFATANGLMRLTPKGYEEVTWHGRRMYGSKMDADSTYIYLLTTHGDLFVLDADDTFIPIDDLAAPPPYTQLKLLDGMVYLLARKQLLQLRPSQGRLVLENMIVGLEISAINDVACYGQQLALATDDGLILLNPKHKEIFRKPEIVVTALHIAGKAWPIDSLAVVDYDHNEIAIDYAILHFRTLGEFPLYYRINDGVWSRTQPESRQLLLAQLAPADYVIEFCLGEPCGNVAARVHVRIRKPFWMQWWFYGLGIAVLGGLVVLAFWQRSLRTQRRHVQHLEKLALENNLRQSTLTAIRSQMNPHFFFNALNTIQAYIFSDDKKNATNYLSKFSKLTRMVLEMSEREHVSLAEEMQAITLYLELEKSRFGDDFQFEIVVGPGISPLTVQMPSMIIQPFVENAVKHGLLHQSGVKEVRVLFATEGQLLVVEVDDNGIGRKRSEELNRIRQERHQPFSVAANKKRIDILNEGHTHIGVAFTDKYDADGRACGTTVKITLPLQLHRES